MGKNALKLLLFISILCCNSFSTQAIADMNGATFDRGKYLVSIGGCNDCHTEGYLLKEGKVPESEWLKGSSFGWRGPWGTTYPPNLRLFIKDLTEAQWVEKAQTLKRRPPMPWFDLNLMSGNDLRAIYRYIKSLGDPGTQAPAFIPPDKEPPMPYATFPPPPPEAKSAPDSES